MIDKVDDIKISVVHSFDEMQQALAIRAAVFMGEQGSYYMEEFDGNDLCATHILASINGEPIGVMRIRWFYDFAKLERMAVLKKHRNFSVLRRLARYAVELCRNKGYLRVYGYAEERVTAIWRRLGFEIIENRPEKFSENDSHIYFPVVGILSPSSSPIDHSCDIKTINLPEGEWGLES
ncbi:MAG: GNAT family N-acetyltransferase [Alphaproteobacteria bacterium]